MPPAADLHFALEMIADCADGVPEGLFDKVVPIRPQRIPGYLSVIRFPSILRRVQDGYVAVMCDLTHVGGTYFATVLPRNISHDALVQYLHPLTSASEQPLRFVVGCRARVWPCEALVTLITMVRLLLAFGTLTHLCHDIAPRNCLTVALGDSFSTSSRLSDTLRFVCSIKNSATASGLITSKARMFLSMRLAFSAWMPLDSQPVISTLEISTCRGTAAP